MTAARIAGMVLIVVGLVGILWGGFSFTREKTVVGEPFRFRPSPERSRSWRASCCSCCRDAGNPESVEAGVESADPTRPWV
jgi:hypothetical protein